MRLIDADKLDKPIYAEEDNITGSGMSYDEMCGYNDGIDEVWNRIQSAPTVDAVVVVRCKDCRSCRELNRKDRVEDVYVEGVLWCMNQSNGVWPDDFCSYGEPKEDPHADDHD